MTPTLSRLSPLLMAFLISACCQAPVPAGDSGPAPNAEDAPTVAEAMAFLDQVETRLLSLWVHNERAAWLKETNITHDTEKISAEASAMLMSFTAETVPKATRFDGVTLSPEARRKMNLLKRSPTLPSPPDAALTAELAEIAAGMPSSYGKAQACENGVCRTLGELSEVMASSRNPTELLAAWKGWRDAARPLKKSYQRYAELGNEGARGLGFKDLGALWRSKYDMDPDAFAEETDRLYGQLEPLYRDLHCHVRARLNEIHGSEIVPLDKAIPAHLLGNMWAQSWGNLFDLLAPEPAESLNLDAILAKKYPQPTDMVRQAESFFTSLGMEALPKTFWERSMFVKPEGREVVCHASAWDIDWRDDLRIKMCIQPTLDEFITIHHELGHNYYQRAYKELSPLFTDSANDGFHEALGDVLALSVTPSYLVEIGVLDALPPDSLNPLMRQALDKVAFLPFGLLVDRWRWDVLSGETPPENYTSDWWKLREKYQGVAAPMERSEDDFDPGAKYHVPGGVPYTRYFLASILQFQFHRALCREIGHKGPLHTCSIHGHKLAGEKIQAMMEMGLSRPWPDALEAITGSREMDASAITEYFAPLHAWLKTQNKGRTCGW